MQMLPRILSDVAEVLHEVSTRVQAFDGNAHLDDPA